MNNEPKQYTVLLMRPDYIATQYGEDTYMTYAEAADPKAAIEKAQKEVYNADFKGASEEDKKDHIDYVPLMVIEGYHNDVKDQS